MTDQPDNTLPDEQLVDFFAIGTPKPGGSKRAFRHKTTGKVMVTDANRDVQPWRDTVAAAASAVMAGRPPLTGPLRLVARFYFPRRTKDFGTGRNAQKLKASAPAAPIVRPDLSKLLRSTEDAMTGIVWRDDATVVEQVASKHYADAATGDVPGVAITVQPMGRKVNHEHEHANTN